ncbi:MAG: hypothetical protein LBU05_04630 [Bifidobacteriaceae bacterium]|nr:hypothetical protein [Bifidobacteriaceae bacterium]
MTFVLVDTSVWSAVLRRQSVAAADQPLAAALAELVLDVRIAMIGPIRQELLSGISDREVFRRHGVQGSAVDFLICAVAAANGWPVFTADRDFNRYAEHLPIDLFQPTSAPS